VLLYVHSNWRLQFKNDDVRMALGEQLNRFYAGVTDVEVRDRYQSIQRMVARADLHEHLILDDARARDEFPADCPGLVVCDPMVGICDAHVKSAVQAWLRRTATPRLERPCHQDRTSTSPSARESR